MDNVKSELKETYNKKNKAISNENKNKNKNRTIHSWFRVTLMKEILTMHPSPKCDILFFCLFFFFRATPTAYGGSSIGVDSELQLLAYTTATAMPDP